MGQFYWPQVGQFKWPLTARYKDYEIEVISNVHLTGVEVYVDRNSNSIAESEEWIGTTDEYARITISGEDSIYPLIAKVIANSSEYIHYDEDHDDFHDFGYISFNYEMMAPARSHYITPYTDITFKNNMTIESLAESLQLNLPYVKENYWSVAWDGSEETEAEHFNNLEISRSITDYYVANKGLEKTLQLSDIVYLSQELWDEANSTPFGGHSYYVVENLDGDRVLNTESPYEHHDDYFRTMLQKTYSNKIRVFPLDSGDVNDSNEINSFILYAEDYPTRSEYISSHSICFEDNTGQSDENGITCTRYRPASNEAQIRFEQPINGIKTLTAIHVEDFAKDEAYGNARNYAIAVSDTNKLYWLDVFDSVLGDNGEEDVGVGRHLSIVDTKEVILTNSDPDEYTVVYDSNTNKDIQWFSTFKVKLDEPGNQVFYKGISYPEGYTGHAVYANNNKPNYIRFLKEYRYADFTDSFGVTHYSTTITCSKDNGFGVISGRADSDFILVADIKNLNVFAGVFAAAGCKGPNGIKVNHFGVTSKDPELLEKLMNKFKSLE